MAELQTMREYCAQETRERCIIASLLEEYNSLKIKVAAAMAKNDQATLNKKIHVIDHEAERERKRTNPGKSTRVMFNCRTPEQWKEFQAAKEPYFEVAGDPHIAVDCIIRALCAFSENTIRDWIAQGFEAGPQPPKAEIPQYTDFRGTEALKESGQTDVPDWLK